MIFSKKKWGPLAWHLLHSFSINNNCKISDNKKHNFYILYSSFVYILPCEVCSEHYSNILYNIEPLEECKINRLYMMRWVFKVHNIINDFLNKKIYKYKNFIKNKDNINHKSIFFILKYIYANFNYDTISLYKYDQIYNFFINFCILYPNKNIRNNLKKIIKDKSFKDIKTPKEFKKWFIENITNLKNIIIV
jgi:hypothetical protein